MPSSDKKRKTKRKGGTGVHRQRSKGRGAGAGYLFLDPLALGGGSRKTRRRGPRRWAVCARCTSTGGPDPTVAGGKAQRVYRTRLAGYEGQNTLCKRHR